MSQNLRPPPLSHKVTLRRPPPLPLTCEVIYGCPFSLHSSLKVREHVSQPYSTTGNIIVLYILILKFLERSS